MRVAVVGSQSFHEYDLMRAVLDESLTKGDIIVSGGCPLGADFFAEEYAKANRYETNILPADWSTGIRAGFDRNADIEADSDVCIAFWDGVTNGTRDTIRLFKASGKHVKVVPFKPRTWDKEVDLSDMFE